MRSSTVKARIQSGFSLVEALVALVVLSVGMLGIAALYMESLRSARTALFRSQAIVLATDMGDRIRANLTAVDNYAKTEDATGTLTSNCETASAGCNPQTMAAHDIARWHNSLDGRVGAPTSLPGGRGTITITPPGAGSTLRSIAIIVSWTEINQTTPDSYTMRIEA
jgi:type IV pilus assembly protein PilV